MARSTPDRSRVLMSLFVLALLAVGLWGVMHLRSSHGTIPAKTDWQAGPATMGALDLTWHNYSEEVKAAAAHFDLPADYLLALITLECSGRKPAGARFEPGVYNRLLAVRAGDRRKYEQVKTSHLEDATDAAVTNLATSWGPFQLMGYKCIGMEVNVADIRGDSAIWHGARWIADEYGKHLRKAHFKDAFHIHNTGRKYPAVGGPKTHDPKYVDKGLERMGWFREKLEE